MIAAMAQWEREEIAERVAASVPIRAKMGKPLGGQAPYGYQWKDKKLIPDEKEAPVRKLMYELFREHGRKKTVARLLNDRGYRTRNGSAFSDTTVDRLLRDSTAKGIRRANYTKSENSKKAWALKPEDEWILHEVEPIVSEDLWSACVALLDEKRAKGKRPAKQVTHLFTGVTYCSCGQKMYVPSNSPKYTCYKCRNKIPVVDLEAVFHEQIRNFLFSDAEIAAHLEKADATIKERAELLNVLESERKKLAGEVDKLYDLYQSGMIDKHGFGAKYHPLAERQRQLDEELPQVQANLDVLKISHLSQEEVIADARDLYTRWPTLPGEEKRRIVEAITERIVVGNGEVEINLYYSPPPFSPRSGGGSTGPAGGTPSPSTTPLDRGILATQQCPCGYLGHFNDRCRCTADQVARYRGKISGPLLDRIDIHLEVPAVPQEDLLRQAAGEASGAVRERVATAHQVQIQRQGKSNSRLGTREIDRWCRPQAAAEGLLRQAISRLNLSARAYHRVLKLARTIADLAGSEVIAVSHVAEAIQYRKLDRMVLKTWQPTQSATYKDAWTRSCSCSTPSASTGHATACGSSAIW